VVGAYVCVVECTMADAIGAHSADSNKARRRSRSARQESIRKRKKAWEGSWRQYFGGWREAACMGATWTSDGGAGGTGGQRGRWRA
jgi:hypothetical protein